MDKRGKKNLTSMLLTVLVLALYLLPNFASAVVVRISTDKSSYENSEVVKFDVSVDIDDGERIPVKNLTLKVNNTIKQCTFRPDGTFISGCDNMNITCLMQDMVMVMIIMVTDMVMALECLIQ